MDPKNVQEDTQQLFIKLLFGKNEEELFNPHCKNLILLECMRVKSDCKKDVKLDLMDEKGQLINIFDNKNLEDYASKFLQGRKLYFLVKIIPRQDVKDIPGGVKYEAVLQDMDQRFPHLAERLRKLSDQSKKKKKRNIKSKKHANKQRLAQLNSPTKYLSDSSDN